MGGVVSGVGKMFGGGGGGAKRSQAEGLQQEAFDYIRDIRLPTLADLQINPSDIEYYQVTGKFTPALYEAVKMDKTLLEDLDANPDLVKDQMAGIQAKKARIAEGGLSIEDRARMQEVLKESDRQNRAQQETIGARLRERGAGGSPLEAMMRLQGQGAAADTASDNAFKVAALAATSKLQEEDKLQSMLDRMVQQDVGLKGARAQAEAERQKMNTNLLNQQNLTNTQLQNYAQAQNLANEQRVADANVGLANQRMQYNKAAIQQDLGNRMNQGQLMAGAAGQYAGQLNKQADQRDAEKAAKWDNIGRLTDAGIGLATAGFGSDKNIKKDIKPASKEADEMLDKLKGYNFKYKDEANGEGERVGIMAQDLEKSKMGKKLVKDSPEGKSIDVKNALGAIMAAQARLAERLKKIEKKK